jgi:hypothetical protein
MLRSSSQAGEIEAICGNRGLPDKKIKYMKTNSMSIRRLTRLMMITATAFLTVTGAALAQTLVPGPLAAKIEGVCK